MIDKFLIEKKIEKTLDYLGELKQLLIFSDEEISADYLKLHTAERLLQLVVDEILDINLHIIREQKLISPDDLQSSFKILADNNSLPQDFANKIAPVVGLRNNIVHNYEKLDKNLFLKNLRNNFGDFEKYLILIKNKFL